MKLPNNVKAYVPLLKLTDYLLLETHAIGKAKAKFLRGFGFDETNVNLLEQSLITIAQSEEVKEIVSSIHGTKYVIEGSLQTPSGEVVRVQTVWIIETGQERPR
ncbi:MAG TPA: hypothetical protein VEC96_12635, partial [Anaerolineae bacterium]|nr:hypothetical protein [Anaerolineae bacterium]